MGITLFRILLPVLRAPAIRTVFMFALIALSPARVFANAGTAAAPVLVTTEDTRLLDDVEHRAVRFFLEHTDATTGLSRDRAPANGSPASSPSSIAATGFALTAWCIADARGWLPPGEAQRRVRQSLRFAADHVAHERGWFYHFVDARTGQRAWKSEASTIDTALFLQGALFAREYLRDRETTALVQRIYARIDWRWALNGGGTLSHGWRPESGFIPHRWDSYSELMGLYLLGIGAPAQPLAAGAWHAWSREPRARHEGRSFIQCGPLFTHQYAHGWFDFRGQRDAYADYFQNSVDATLAQRAWSARQSGRFQHWSSELWGLTASDGPRGYMDWGTPGRGPDRSDGTLVPCAPGGSLPFAPRECLTALHRMRETGGAAVWGRYGFADAFNPEIGWTSPDVIGIDLGIMLVMAENFRSGLVWRSFMRAPEVQRGMQRAGFAPATGPASNPPAVVARASEAADVPKG
ncbi:MAG TPA: glucoamylase family protein [Opitutaceae bacterium]|nr:glucoamylase family protein [Opitutaceae bacterium]